MAALHESSSRSTRPEPQRGHGGAWLLVLVASLALLVAVLDGYIDHVAVNHNQFVDRASVVLSDESVQLLIANRVTDQVIERVPELGVARPVVHSVVVGVVGTPAFANLFRASVLEAHQALIDGSASTLTLNLANLGGVIASTLQAVDPAAASVVRESDHIVLLSRNVGSVTAAIAHDAKLVSWLWILCAAVFASCACLAIAISRPRRWAIRRIGAGAAIAGGLLLIALLAGRSIAVGQVNGADASAAVGAVWDAFLGGLRTISLVMMAAGLVIAVAARGGKPA